VTLWAGRVEAQLAPEVWEFLKVDDAELLPYDVKGTLLHAERLHAAGLLDDAELTEVRETLAALDSVDPAAEDVHSFIEAELGAVGRKIHAGRSRNDQVAAALRLYVEDACAEADRALVAFASAILEHAAADATTPMPGYTHFQRAQPITLGHHLLAWSEMLERDRARFAFAGVQAQPSPLGSGALAGSTLPLRCATRVRATSTCCCPTCSRSRRRLRWPLHQTRWRGSTATPTSSVRSPCGPPAAGSTPSATCRAIKQGTAATRTAIPSTATWSRGVRTSGCCSASAAGPRSWPRATPRLLPCQPLPALLT